MQPAHLTAAGFLLALTAAGTPGAWAEDQVCIHRTADGRCLHWVPASASPARVQGQAQGQPSSTSSTPSAPTSGCAYDARSGSYRECYHIASDGSCVHLGGRCN